MFKQNFFPLLVSPTYLRSARPMYGHWHRIYCIFQYELLNCSNLFTLISKAYSRLRTEVQNKLSTTTWATKTCSWSRTQLRGVHSFEPQLLKIGHTTCWSVENTHNPVKRRIFSHLNLNNHSPVLFET